MSRTGRLLRSLLSASILAGLLAGLSASAALAVPLPPHKRIAVVVFEQASGFFRAGLGVGAAETMITQALIGNGYPVVNAAQVERIKRDRRAELLAQGDARAIRELGKTYDVRIFLVGRATLAEALKNDFGTYTGTATVAVQAYSATDGKYLFSDMASGKELGGTPDEAAQRALEAASRVVATNLIAGEGKAGGVSGGGAAPASAQEFQVLITDVRDFNVPNRVLEAIQHLAGARGAAIVSYAGGVATISVQYIGTAQDLSAGIARQSLPIRLTGVSGNRISASAQ